MSLKNFRRSRQIDKNEAKHEELLREKLELADEKRTKIIKKASKKN